MYVYEDKQILPRVYRRPPKIPHGSPRIDYQRSMIDSTPENDVRAGKGGVGRGTLEPSRHEHSEKTHRFMVVCHPLRCGVVRAVTYRSRGCVSYLLVQLMVLNCLLDVRDRSCYKFILYEVFFTRRCGHPTKRRSTYVKMKRLLYVCTYVAST